jgi:hypothetical protein
MGESNELVEVLKEIRDELRAVRTELGARGPRMTTSGVRTQRVARERRWRITALAAGGVAALALVLGLVTRDRPAPAPVAVASQVPPTPAKALMPAGAVIPAPAPVALTAPVPPVAVPPAAKLPAATPPATRPAARGPAGMLAPAAIARAAVPAPAKKHVKPDVAAKSPAEVASDEDETLAFPPPPRRVRVHRLSYGPVESEPAKL